MSSQTRRRSPSTQQRKFNRSRFDWLNKIQRDPGVSNGAYRVASALSNYFNYRTGRAWPSLDSLAADSTLCRAGVFKAIEQLKARGYLKVLAGSQGKGNANRYQMAAGFVHSSEQRFVHPSKRFVHPSEVNLTKNSTMEPLQGSIRRETEPSVRSKTGATDADAPRPVFFKNGENPSRVEKPKQPQDYERLAQIWARPWPDDPVAGARAFTQACERGADPDAIIAGARAWATAADAPRYLPPLERWLDQGCWAKEPPKRRQRNGWRNGAKADAATYFFTQFAGGCQ
jgi:hypothetical protein